jgi:dTDP-4-dehydrorhamnose reductase
MDRHTPVLVVGAESVLGTALAACLTTRGVRVLGTSRRGTPGLLPLDLAASPSTWNLPKAVGAAVICAATTSTTECRTHPDRARVINVDATVNLAARLVASGAHVVFPSSNQVFDGTAAYTVAHTTPCPVTSYGRMKAEAEAAILGLGKTTLVARLTKIIDREMPLFAGWQDALRHGQPIHPFADLPMAPLTPGFAAEAIAAAVDHGLAGILQVSAAADVPYAEAAVRMARTAGLSASLVQPVSAATAETVIEHVPCHTTLDTTTLRERLGIAPPSPWVAVEALLR